MFNGVIKMDDGNKNIEIFSLLSKRGKRLLETNDNLIKNPIIEIIKKNRKNRIEKEGKKCFVSRSKSLFGYKTELIKNKILEAKETFFLDPAILTHYPPSPTGMESIKVSCANFICSHLSCNISPKQLIITPGTTATLDMLAFTLFDPSDCILCPAPYINKYHEIFAIKNNINLIPIYFEDINTPKLSRSQFESTYLKCKKVKGILISNPHNPTGSIFSSEQIREIIQFSEDKKILLIMDEATSFSIYDNDGKEKFNTILKDIERFKKYKNIFWTWSFSKDMLLPGLRFSLVYMEDEKTFECMDKLSSYYTVNGLTQNFAEEFLHDKQWFDELQKTKNEELSSNREMAMTILRNLKIPFVKPLGGFLIYFDLTHIDQNILIKFLENNIHFEHVGGKDHDGYKKGWFAINLCQKRQHLYDVLEKMGNIIKEYNEKRFLQKERSISNVVADDVIKQVLDFLNHPKDNDNEIVRKTSETINNCQLFFDESKNYNKYEKNFIEHIVNECHLSDRESMNPLIQLNVNEEKRISTNFNARSQQKDNILLQSPTTNQKKYIVNENDTSPDFIGEMVVGEPSKIHGQSHIINYDGVDNNLRCSKVNCPICEIEKKKENVDDKVNKNVNPVDLEEVFQIKLNERIDNIKNDWISDMFRKNCRRRSKSYDITNDRSITKIDEEMICRDDDNYYDNIIPENITITKHDNNSEGEFNYQQSNETEVHLNDNKVNPRNTIKMNDDDMIYIDSIVKRQVLPNDKVENNNKKDSKLLPNQIPLQVIFNQPKSEKIVTKELKNNESIINDVKKTIIKEQKIKENDYDINKDEKSIVNDIEKSELGKMKEIKSTVIRKEDNFMKLDSDIQAIDSISDIVIEDGDIIIVEEKKTIIEGGDSGSDKNSLLLDYIFSTNNNITDNFAQNNKKSENISSSEGRKIIESEKLNSYTVRSIDNTKSEMMGNNNNINLNQIFLNDGDQKEFKDKVFDNLYILTKNDTCNDRIDIPSAATITFCRAETNIESPFDHQIKKKSNSHSQLIEPTKVNFLSTEELNVNEDGTKIYTESSYDTEMNLKKDEDIDKASIHFEDYLNEHIYITLDNTKINDEVFMGIMKNKFNDYHDNNISKQPLTITDGDSNDSFSYIKIPDNTNKTNKISEEIKIDNEESVKKYNPIDLNLIFIKSKSINENPSYIIDDEEEKDINNKNETYGEENEPLFDGSFSSSVGGRRYLSHEYRKVSSYHVPHSGVEKKIQKKNTPFDGYGMTDDGKSCDSGFTGDKIDNDLEIKKTDENYENKCTWNNDIEKEDLKRSISLKNNVRRLSNESDNSNERNKEWIQDWERTNSFKDMNKNEPRERGTSFTEVTVDLSDIIGISIKENNSDLGDSAYLSMSPELRKKDKRDSGYCRDSVLSSDTRKSYTPRRLSYSYDITGDGTITTPNEPTIFLRECKKDNKYNGIIPNEWNLTNEIIETNNKNKQKYIEYMVTKNEYKSIPLPENYEVTNDILLEVRLIQRQQGSAVGYYYPPKKDTKTYVTELHLLPTPDYNFYSTELHIPREEIYINNNTNNKKEVDYIHPETNAKHFIIKSFQKSPIKTRRITAKPLKFENNYIDGKDGITITYEIFKKTDDDISNNSIISIKENAHTLSINTKNNKKNDTLRDEDKKSWYITTVKKTPRPAFNVPGSLSIDIKLYENDI
ncbi:Aminotransferase, class I/classII domain and Pyridoxal phosphate-dependent transferase, major region, subdomain 1 and Pyridoxal phosphate-dependent transferase, major region, subdomain 2 and Pyridoxal phosphate-dependent transferase domain-containing protein [Strongyloides ratti]|uniref:Aminotran_1_2 domain-containing protein n=1 Tax=Strongyloides ratti TaxID=34506 RepID=A0A090L372_STRRB|nr:Aminotransferase, class I/classII domain and Pyridoxal phosphate-dependent transferase, major region, subdomain 1 and Pyridoxal phosphate-dependent transferase, major region, subdomain 2 and Pyridoxal phosphate-dependent transferase domain-containing protein [Strongyloides ratti]CEF61944.1 Aminotransferase, class I/classII domain and Pyridoxal phosphate-dependent transferase, major region, subdomain 1 and Pyridoxal phosphate-dependent transferase, major region, subdomain 2 and Pyridoxal phospha